MATQLQRPSRSDDDVLLEAAKALIINLDDKEFRQDPETLASVTSALRHAAPLFDGYEICRELERTHHWQPDAQMVNDMDSASGEISVALRQKTSEWVRACGIRPQRELGAQVEVEIPGKDGRLAKYTGEITGIHDDQATYLVMIPALGHQRSGLGTHGTIIPFEKIHDLAEPVEAFELLPSPRG